MRSLALLLPLAALVACQPRQTPVLSGLCDGSPARSVSQTGTLNVVWGATAQFYLRVGERSLELLIDRPERVSSDILQGLSARSVRVDGRESESGTKICADVVITVEGL